MSMNPPLQQNDGPLPIRESRTGAKKRLVDAAVRLFAKKGFGTTSVQEIVEMAGVTKGAMYHYFNSKDEILFHVLSEFTNTQSHLLEKAKNATGTGGEKLFHVAVDILRSIMTEIDLPKIFLHSRHELKGEYAVAIQATRRSHHELLREIIKDGQLDGSFSPEVPPGLAISYFYGAVHYLAIWYTPSGEMTPGEIADWYARMFLATLSTPLGAAN